MKDFKLSIAASTRLWRHSHSLYW